MSGELKKKIRPGSIQLHPEEQALVVNYEAQEILLLPDGGQQLQSSKPSTKKISVKTLSSKSNIPLLASEIIDKCKLIHSSKLGQVQDLLQELLDRSRPQEQSTSQPSSKARQSSGSGAAAARPAINYGALSESDVKR